MLFWEGDSGQILMFDFLNFEIINIERANQIKLLNLMFGKRY